MDFCLEVVCYDDNEVLDELMNECEANCAPNFVLINKIQMVIFAIYVVIINDHWEWEHALVHESERYENHGMLMQTCWYNTATKHSQKLELSVF